MTVKTGITYLLVGVPNTYKVVLYVHCEDGLVWTPNLSYLTFRHTFYADKMLLFSLDVSNYNDILHNISSSSS